MNGNHHPEWPDDGHEGDYYNNSTSHAPTGHGAAALHPSEEEMETLDWPPNQEEDEPIETWAQARERIHLQGIDGGGYYNSLTGSGMHNEFADALRKLGIGDFVCYTRHLTAELVDPDCGSVELRFVERAGGALRDVIASCTCPVCQDWRQSFPLTEPLELVAFVMGDDAPCQCHLRCTVQREQVNAEMVARIGHNDAPWT